MGIEETRGTLLEINRERNTTIVLSSHILSELEQITTKILFIDNEKIIQLKSFLF
ncbi:hypothetical protein [Paenibacillus sp. FSL R10-2734]|uniref:hypothetical protein n=1 Tax=Paenibacillus sp. FSL R10-2734 TaxID=2954691 RepID=UPI0030D70563